MRKIKIVSLLNKNKQKKNRIILPQKYAPVIEPEQNKLKLFQEVKKTILKLLKKLKKSNLEHSMNNQKNNSNCIVDWHLTKVKSSWLTET